MLTTEGHAGATYALGGPAFTLTELASTISSVTSQRVTYTDLPTEACLGVLVGAAFDTLR